MQVISYPNLPSCKQSHDIYMLAQSHSYISIPDIPDTSTSHAISTRVSHIHTPFLSLPMFAADGIASLPTTFTTTITTHQSPPPPPPPFPCPLLASKSHRWTQT